MLAMTPTSAQRVGLCQPSTSSLAPIRPCTSHILHTPFRCRTPGGRCPRTLVVRAEQPTKQSDPSETTEKFGLEAGLWQVFRTKDANGMSRTDQAKQLLKTYGSAYLITSISFAIVSFAACYALVSSGVDIGAVLEKIGIQVNTTSEKVGTAAIAYAAHKALSPVRFPPTVALTPVVARMLGRKGSDNPPPGGMGENNGNGSGAQT